TSGTLTVWLQPRLSLWPREGNGEPGKVAPAIFQPLSLWTCPSIHWPGPKNGWCGLTKSIACPDALLDGAIAQVFEPTCPALHASSALSLIATSDDRGNDIVLPVDFTS